MGSYLNTKNMNKTINGNIVEIVHTNMEQKNSKLPLDSKNFYSLFREEVIVLHNLHSLRLPPPLDLELILATLVSDEEYLIIQSLYYYYSDVCEVCKDCKVACIVLTKLPRLTENQLGVWYYVHVITHFLPLQVT